MYQIELSDGSKKPENRLGYWCNPNLQPVNTWSGPGGSKW